ncbi:flagellin [Fictibacillus nanhaiensis]|uniref:flagellin N-terminal helical domain-containing protein n=1 Tax=Fictibacillus nanhaiensis TaxID=742169 RepID=UPI002E234750|nr:flagellin [Fictibacillus nanhaiensis]MED1862426.1 flagellin [Fictibacillus nanhaiensis]
MRINHNIAALNTYRQLNSAATGQSKSMEKLSSGLRINRAGDDAAGLAISEKMRGQIRGLDMASKNAQDGISLISTAEGALNETHDILQRMRELSVQSSNDTNTIDDRKEIQKEIDQLTSELDRIGNTTEFNTKKLINGGASVSGSVADTDAGDAAKLSIIGGTGDTTAGASITLSASTVATAATDATTATFALSTTALGAASSITINGTKFDFAATDTVQNALDAINDAGIGVKASHTDGAGISLVTNDKGSSAKFTVNAVSGALAGLATASGSDATVTAASGFTSYKAEGDTVTILDGAAKGLELKVNGALSNVANTTVTVTSNGTLNLQIGANENQEMNISIKDMRAAALGVDGLDVTAQSGASTAISTLDKAIQSVSAERSKLGAYSNRLEHSINNLNTSSENLTAAESRIRDVDYALAA